MKNRKREICTSGTVRDEDGNILIYSANDKGGSRKHRHHAKPDPRLDPTRPPSNGMPVRLHRNPHPIPSRPRNSRLIGKPSDQRRWRINPVRTRRRSIIIISPTGPDKNRTYLVPAFTFTILIPTTVVAVSFMTTTFPALFMTPAFFATFTAFFMILRTAWACTFFLTFRTAWASLGFATALLSTSGCMRCKCKTCRNDGR